MIRKRHRLCGLAAVLALCSALCGCMGGVEIPEQESKPNTEEPFSIADIRPGDDFYGWCNAAELMEMHIPEDERSVGTLSDVAKRVDEQTGEIIRGIADSSGGYAPGTNEQLIYDLYHLAYDTYTKAGDTTAYDEQLAHVVFDDIDAADSIDALCTLWGRLGTKYGLDAAILPSVTPDLYDSSVNALYIQQTYGLGNLEDAVEHEFYASDLRNQLQRDLSASGIEKEDARERATQITYLLLDIGSVTEFYDDDKEMVLSESWFPYTQAELAGRLHNITCGDLLRLLAIPDYTGGIVLANEAQFFMIESLLDDAHLQAWKDYTRCCFVEQFSMTLPGSCGGMNAVDGMTPEDFAVMAVNVMLPREVGELYAEAFLTENVRGDATRMCQEILDEYAVLISGADWLSADGKAALLSKLRGITCFVGADVPHEVDPADAGRIGKSLLEMQFLDCARQRREELAMLGQPAERNGFSMMPPQTVNACYDPQANCFTITAAILNAPIYDPEADHAANLGSIGTIIGHEISHAFDDKGMDYDAAGCYRPEWMPEADREAFAEIRTRAAEYYSGFTVMDTYRVKGRKTLGENLADISGVQCALAIAGTPDKQKLVLEHYADTWKELTLDSDAKLQIETDVHSPGPVRVNAVVACFDEFYSIYDVQEGDKLYVAPADRIRRW